MKGFQGAEITEQGTRLTVVGERECRGNREGGRGERGICVK